MYILLKSQSSILRPDFIVLCAVKYIGIMNGCEQ